MNVAFFLHPKKSVSYIYNDNTVYKGLEKMRANGFSAIPVISRNGKYCGTISEGDFLWYIAEKDGNFDMKTFRKTKIKEIIKIDKYPPVRITASADELLSRVINQNFVPVIDDFGIFMGIVTRRDIIKYFCEDKQHNLK
ncbi:MAG TPA: CBS domain-containing protein [Candidatus Moranbacteria bacterium]|nr:CBS domain-containing protein [Candidatus Moranbacteria bacterium]